MLVIVPPDEYIELLCCPHCRASLAADGPGRSVFCTACSRQFPITEQGVLELVDREALDSETQRELEGNTYETSVMGWAETIVENESVETSYYWAARQPSIQRLADYLAQVDTRRLFFLGTGTGRDILLLFPLLRLDRVYASDLSVSALRRFQYRLDRHSLKAALFTSDLSACPIGSREIPVVVVGALHHTQNMHSTLEQLLSNGYHHLFLVEPIENWLTQLLARAGIARRVEYSGVNPDRFRLSVVRQLCQQYGYCLTFSTSWVFPADYYHRLFPKRQWVQHLFLSLISGFTALTKPVNWGNRAVLHLVRKDAGADSSLTV